jgi:hypothetical protein
MVEALLLLWSVAWFYHVWTVASKLISDQGWPI